MPAVNEPSSPPERSSANSSSAARPSTVPSSPSSPTATASPDVLHVVLATLNEAGNIGWVIERLTDAASALGRTLRVIVVDDGSTDDTLGVARRAVDHAGTASLDLVAVDGPRQGFGGAHLRGFELARAARAGVVVTLDGDAQHDPREIPAMLAMLERDGADLVIGSRYARGGSSPGLSWPRSLMSRAGNALLRIVTRSSAHDMTSGFRVLRANVIDAFEPEPTDLRGYNFLSAFAATTHARGMTIAEHPIALGPRLSGTSKLNRKHLTHFAANLPRLGRRCHVLRADRAGRRTDSAAHAEPVRDAVPLHR